MATLAIRGHESRGKEIIELLEMLGCKTAYTLFCSHSDWFYFVDKDGFVQANLIRNDDGFNVYTLEEFLEKFPYKVGDKVTAINGDIGTVVGMQWSNNKNDVVYNVLLEKDEIMYSWNVRHLQPYKEQEPMEGYIIKSEDIKASKISITAQEAQMFFDKHVLPERMELVFGDDFELKQEDGRWFVVKKKPQYPKTYAECCKVLDRQVGYDDVEGYKYKQFTALQRLIVCRDAYWKLAGDWKPSNEERVYAIFRHKGKVLKDELGCGNCVKLEFPTEEMRDAFYENFKDLIEQCKEFL